MRGNEKCYECKYFTRCDVPKEKKGLRNDGYCSKVFPRGYTNAGKPGGYKYSGDAHCFQFEEELNVRMD